MAEEPVPNCSGKGSRLWLSKSSKSFDSYQGIASAMPPDRWQETYIHIDVKQRVLEVEVSDAALRQRLAGWKPPAPRYASGVFAKYAALVSSAAEGAITRAD